MQKTRLHMLAYSPRSSSWASVTSPGTAQTRRDLAAQPSRLVLGIDLASADRWHAATPDGIVWADADAIPTLVLLR